MIIDELKRYVESVTGMPVFIDKVPAHQIVPCILIRKEANRFIIYALARKISPDIKKELARARQASMNILTRNFAGTGLKLRKLNDFAPVADRFFEGWMIVITLDRHKGSLAGRLGAGRPDYLKLTARNNGVVLRIVKNGSPDLTTFEYSTDCKVWTKMTDTVRITLNQGEYLLCRSRNAVNLNSSNRIQFASIGSFNVSGDLSTIVDYTHKGKFDISSYENLFFNLFQGCTGLYSSKDLDLSRFSKLGTGTFYQTFSSCTGMVDSPELPCTYLGASSYLSMFLNCTSLINAASLLPALNIPISAYSGMFKGCTSLVKVPDILATYCERNSCTNMFYGCTALQEPPIINFETIEDQGVAYMFYGCTSLKSSPVMRFSLSSNYYNPCKQMFDGCTTLNRITTYASHWNSTKTISWVNNVAPAGVFTKLASTSIPRGVNGIPEGWTVENIDGVSTNIDSSVMPVIFTDSCDDELEALVFTGGNRQSLLPEGYTQLESIYSSGFEYIDTGFIPVQNDNLTLTIENFQTLQSAGKSLLGCSLSEWSSATGWFLGISGGSGLSCWNCYMSNIDTTYTSLGIEQGKKYTLYVDSTGFYVNTSRKAEWTGNYHTPIYYDRSIWLFMNNGTGEYNSGKWAFGRTTILRNGTTVFDGIPAKNSSNVLGMYDLISNTFKTNASGIGGFTAGLTAPSPGMPIKPDFTGDSSTAGGYDLVFDVSGGTGTGRKTYSVNMQTKLMGFKGKKYGVYDILAAGDTADIINGIITRNIDVMTFDGSQQFEMATSPTGCFYYRNHSFKSINFQPALCTHFTNQIVSTTSQINDGCFAIFPMGAEGTIAKVTFRHTGCERLQDFMDWITEQAQSGNPVKLYYIKNEPTIEPVDRQTVTSYEGTNTMSSSAGAKPLRTQLTYIKKP